MTQTQPYAAFGKHLALDGYGCLVPVLKNLNLIAKFLEEAPGRSGMTKIMPPYVFWYVGKVPEDWGLSGFVLIAESHISLHTFPEKAFLSLDVFSCKDFDEELVISMAVGFFGIQKYEHQVHDRGLEFPRNQKAVQRHLTNERRAWCGAGGG